MKKRLFCILTVLCMLLSSNMALAAEVSTDQNAEISLRYVKVLAMSPGLKISNAGNATCAGSVSVRSGYNVDLTVELMKLENNRWETIKSWDDSGSGVEGVDITKSYWVGRGMYMVKATAYVTDGSGNYVESPSETSVICEY